MAIIYVGKTPALVMKEEENSTRELPLFEYHAPHREWRTSEGMRQLALDLLIDHMGEHPTPEDIKRKYLGVGAWLPHLAYAKYLQTQLQITDAWKLEDLQIRSWLDDWMLSRHTEEALIRYNGAYVGEPFLDWNAGLNDILESMHFTLDTTIVELPHRIVAYLSGMTPHNFCLDWLIRAHQRLLDSS